MIISRTPFRVSFAGGGSDLPSFYQKHRGCVLSTTINKYMYISLHPYFNKHETLLKYSKTELVQDVEDIEHKLFREVLKKFGSNGGLEISSNADIPSGTGLGSSSSFTIGLLNAMYAHKEIFVSKKRLAEEACEIELERLKEPIGKQDHFASAFGGLNFIEFLEDGTTLVNPLVINKKLKQELERNLIMFYLGNSRSASEILSKQNKSMDNIETVNQVLRMTEVAKEMRERLHQGDLVSFGELLHKGWELKRGIIKEISNDIIDKHYEKARGLGAYGGKLLGAGGGGFLLFYCPEEKNEKLIKELGLPHFKINFDTEGSKIVFASEND